MVRSSFEAAYLNGTKSENENKLDRMEKSELQ